MEYTYAIGDKVIVPAGARVYGELQQADPSGLVSMRFEEIELLDGAREKIDAEIAGNNTSAAFSEGDMLREWVATNIETAGDSEIMNLNAKSRLVVSVPADTKIYIVFTKHETGSSELRRVTSAKP